MFTTSVQQAMTMLESLNCSMIQNSGFATPVIIGYSWPSSKDGTNLSHNISPGAEAVVLPLFWGTHSKGEKRQLV